MSPKISIIIPVYNVSGYLEGCLDSILAQTFQDYDVYVVDDGSTDETPAICDRYAAQSDKITVIHKKNEGVSVARNAAIEKAKGEYLLFFDGDDHVEPECLEELYQEAVSKEADSVISSIGLIRDLQAMTMQNQEKPTGSFSTISTRKTLQ